MMMLRRHWWAILYSLFLVAFTAYLVMDTFVISRVYAVVSEDSPGSGGTAGSGEAQEKEAASDPAAVVSESSYRDENITITVTEYREHDTSIYVADIVLSSPEYLQTAFAQNA